MDKKYVIMMAGASGAGKSTTTKAFVIGNPIYTRCKLPVDVRAGTIQGNVHWTVYDNCAVLGSPQNGADANRGPGFIRVAFTNVLQQNLSDVIIIDGKIDSPHWVHMINEVKECYEFKILVLYFELTAEELLHRLAKRRNESVDVMRNNGWYDKCVRDAKSADNLVTSVVSLSNVPYDIVTLTEAYTTAKIVELMDSSVCEYLGGCDD